MSPWGIGTNPGSWPGSTRYHGEHHRSTHNDYRSTHNDYGIPANYKSCYNYNIDNLFSTPA